LDIRRLWVDSICIIQDDDIGWKQQPAHMGMMLERSICTFGAIDAVWDNDKDMGLFLSRDMLPVKFSIVSSFSDIRHYLMLSDLPQQTELREYERNGTLLDVEALSSNAWRKAKVSLTAEHTPFDMSVENSLWNNRGWIFQERVLFTRMLYFTKEQVYWECAECIESEHLESNKGTEKEMRRLLSAGVRLRTLRAYLIAYTECLDKANKSM
jgi:Heterokaryon incompatibility protein (HET)